MQPDLSIVVPLYNESARLRGCMTRLINQMHLNLIPYEIILCLNGCTDDTGLMAEGYTQKYPVRVLTVPERGKGAAVRAGMLSGRRPDGAGRHPSRTPARLPRADLRLFRVSSDVFRRISTIRSCRTRCRAALGAYSERTCHVEPRSRPRVQIAQ